MRELTLAVSLVLAVVAVVAVMRDPKRGLLLMLTLIPLDVAGRIITKPVTVTWFHLALLVTLVSLVVAWRKGTVQIPDTVSPVSIGVGVLVFAALWSLPFSLAPAATAVAAVRLAFQGLLYLAFVLLITNEGMARRVVVVLAVTAVLSSILAVAQFVWPGIGIGSVDSFAVGADIVVRSGAFFDDPNFLGAFLSVAVLAGLGMAVHASRPRGATVWLLTAVVGAVGIVLTFSRTAWVGVLAGAIVVVLAAPRKRRTALLVVSVFVAVLVVAIAPDAVTSRFRSITDVESDPSVRTRYVMLESTREMIGDYWLFGTGLAAYDKAYPRYQQSDAMPGITKPHELPLAIWAEMGIVGLLAEVIIIGALAWMLWKRRKIPWGPYESVGVAALVAMLVQSLFQYYLYVEYLWVALALSVAAARFERAKGDADE